MRLCTRGVAAVTAILLTLLALGAAPAGADGPVGPANCSDGKPWYRVSQVGPATYSPIGDPVGLYNSTPTAATLTFTMEVTKSRKTTWEVGAGGSVSWGIAQVEAHTSFNVSTESTTKKTVSHAMSVPAKKQGYMAPKVQYRTFAVDKMKTVSPCTDVFVERMGKLKAITANPFFSSCIGTECTPKP